MPSLAKLRALRKEIMILRGKNIMKLHWHAWGRIEKVWHTKSTVNSLFVLTYNIVASLIRKQVAVQSKTQPQLIPWELFTGLISDDIELKVYNKLEERRIRNTIPNKITDPKTPQYFEGTFTIEVRIATAARVKKKFQCTPYSPTWT